MNWLSASMLGLLCMTGCATEFSEQPANPSFPGIASLQPTPGDPLRVLFIHGMGVHKRSDSDTLLQHLNKVLGLHQLPPPPDQVARPEADDPAPPFVRPAPILISVQGSPAPAELYTYKFASSDGGKSMWFSFLLWSPMTTSIKMRDLDEPNHPPRAWVNNLAKEFLKDNLSDVVLYGGTYRAVIRLAVEQALCYFVGGTPDAAQPKQCNNGTESVRTAVITHSLAGYMLMDAIYDLSGDDPAVPRIPFTNNAGLKLVTSLDQFYMLANQLELLTLTTLDAAPSLAVQPSTGSVTENRPLRLTIKRMLQHWRFRHSEYARTISGRFERPQQLVAVSDPNDVLSYLVLPSDIDDPQTAFYNVFLPNGELNLFDIFVDPISAHTGYLHNDRVMDLVVCGMKAGTIAVCNY
jgi:hypothetical protein